MARTPSGSAAGGQEVPVASRRLGAFLLTALLVTGCASGPPRPDDAEALRAVTDAVERLHHVLAGEPSPQARSEVETLCTQIKLVRPSTAIYRGLVEGLRDGDDEFNAVLIDLLDEIDAAGMAPVRHRARVETIRAAEALANMGARRAEQAGIYVSHMQDLFRNDLDGLVAVWLGLLESPPIRMRRPGNGPVDVTARVQGVALLGLIRAQSDGDLDGLLGRVKQGRITAPPVLLSQVLIHASGANLKKNLAAWLDGPGPARAAALAAVDSLQFRPLETKSAEAAKAWVAKLPDAATWPALVMGALRETDGPRRLARARRRLSVAGDVDPVKWLTLQPGPSRIRALERLAGIDLLVRPPPFDLSQGGLSEVERPQ